jgi:hypothetical protein
VTDVNVASEKTVVLIFSTDALAAALIGAVVELSGYAPVFANPGESPRDAVMRLRPAAALVDCDHNDACTEAFFGPAMMVGARVAVFSSTRSVRVLQPIAAEFDVRLFSLPIDFAQLSALLADLTKRVEA